MNFLRLCYEENLLNILLILIVVFFVCIVLIEVVFLILGLLLEIFLILDWFGYLFFCFYKKDGFIFYWVVVRRVLILSFFDVLLVGFNLVGICFYWMGVELLRIWDILFVMKVWNFVLLLVMYFSIDVLFV